MLTESEILRMRNCAAISIRNSTSLTDYKIGVLLDKLQDGQFNYVFAELRLHMYWWRFFGNRKIRKMVRRLLVPEYMTSLTALRRLLGLIEEGFSFEHYYSTHCDPFDIISTVNRLRRRAILDCELMMRVYNRIGQLAPPPDPTL